MYTQITHLLNLSFLLGFRKRLNHLLAKILIGKLNISELPLIAGFNNLNF